MSQNAVIFQMIALPPHYTKYRIQKVLYTSKSSQLVLGEDSETGQLIVVKRPTAHCSQTCQELAILPTLSHPGIVKLLGVAKATHSDAPIFPYAPNGDLFQHIVNGALPERTVQNVMYQILQALAYLHRQGVWHRDLKPENILVIGRDVSSVVISDFGLSIRAGSQSLQGNFLGTLEFSAPELLLNWPYTEKVDIWSAGITMFICLTGYNPFDFEQDEETFIEDVIYSDSELMETPPGVSEEAMMLIRRLLANAPEDRPSAEEALDDPWFDPIRGW
jgi:serine/threonine protein kinase